MECVDENSIDNMVNIISILLENGEGGLLAVFSDAYSFNPLIRFTLAL